MDLDPVYTLFQKSETLYYLNNSVKNEPVFGIQNPAINLTWLWICLSRLKTWANYLVKCRPISSVQSYFVSPKMDGLENSWWLRYMTIIAFQISKIAVQKLLKMATFNVDILATITRIIVAALCNRGAIIFLPCGFFLSIFYISFFSSPNLSGHRLDVYHTSTHGVALVRI